MTTDEARVHEMAMSLAERQSAEITRLRDVLTGALRALGADAEQINAVLNPERNREGGV